MEQPQPTPPNPPVAPPPSYPDPPRAVRPEVSPSPHRRIPFLAGVLSFVPGLGNIYNGLYVRGMAIFFLVNGLFALAFRIGNQRNPESQLALIIPTMIFFWLFNLFDAYRQATLINHGQTTDLGLEDQPRLPSYASGSLVLGVALAVVGLYGLLESLFNVDLTILLDYWYLVLLAFGGALIFQSVRNHRERESRNSDLYLGPSSPSSELDIDPDPSN